MSGAEATTLMTSREPFMIAPTSSAVHNSPAPAQTPAASQAQLDQSMRMVYTTDGSATVYRPVGSSPQPYNPVPAGVATVKNVTNLNSGEQKRKRGRPRKYGPDGSMAVAMTSGQRPVGISPPPPISGTFSQSMATPPSVTTPPQPQPHLGGSASPTAKKGRGRPRGSSNKQQKETMGSTGVGFTPHVISVKAGEDVSLKIMAFSQNGPRAICVLSANGAISNVTLSQAATSGGTATYEGRFEILSLSGSFMLSEVGGQRSRNGGLSITLAGPDGRVLGGCVAGLLIAASPVQVCLLLF
ncbi:AT-hook motif nuclear-localized 10-like isoform X1 [Olea europaea subsp. europaea]|uniref:AT-hook motif nuclear-localized protein n=1 Tax=Olea europaea subsp. europaea TaxID=158383 RepID=A0A8S0TC89_OLEEU|nr:AT-hook motif nuclear-localized 10-like isoform X1 [Olea europaea subsp. europaea]